MKILVTSGGTKVPIDSVRDITNMSRGTFGSKIASELLKLGHDVYFFKAKNSKSPFQFDYNFFGKLTLADQLFEEKRKFVERYYLHYNEMEYATFDEYKERLERVIKIERPEIVVLAAAVSDYGVENFVKGKLRSNDDYKIVLKQYPKIIYLIKEWHPECKLVGFKLLVGSKDYQLIEAAQKSIADNKCDMIVANDLAEIKDNKHRVHLVFPDGTLKTCKTDANDPNYLAKMVALETVAL